MNYFGWLGSPASRNTLRATRALTGHVTDRLYRLQTMLTEDGDIYAIGETDIRDTVTGRLFRKAAQITIPRAALRLPEDAFLVNRWNVNDKKPLAWNLEDILEPYLSMLDKMVEGAIPMPSAETPALAAEVA